MIYNILNLCISIYYFFRIWGPTVLLLSFLGLLLYTIGQSNLTEANLRVIKEDLVKKEEPHHHVCDHDNFMKDKKIISFDQEASLIEATLDHEKELRKQHKASNWQPIRILTDYSNMDTTPEIGNFIKTKLDSSTFAFISSAYSVYPKTSISEVIGQSSCYEYSIPAAHSKSGIRSYDLVLYIGVLEAKGENWLARAGPCILDRQTGRPVAGFIQFNSVYLSTLKFDDPADTKWYEWVQTTIHEVTHVLGFSSSMFNYYIDGTTNKQLGNSKVNVQNSGRSWVTLPIVVSETKSYFNCQQSWGAPLENNGGGGTAGSHWEKTTFGNEAMTGSISPGSSFSKFTFKLMEGSGWYLPNYEFAQSYIWGKNEGCNIASGQCTVQNNEFCNSSQNQCSVDSMGTAVCTAIDPLAGGCKYWYQYGNDDCRKHSDYTDQVTGYTGGFVGKGGRCWATSLPKEVGFDQIYTSCYRSTCINGGTQIQFQVANNNYLCTSDGQVINVQYKRYNGTVTCPTISRFCAFENNCPGDCQGRGTCRGSVCQCWAGFSGQDCATKI